MKKILVPLLSCLFFMSAAAQGLPLQLQNQTKNNKLSVVPNQRHGDLLKSTIQRLETNILSGASRDLGAFLGQQVFIDIPGEQNGYFSANQAASLLESFFAQRKPLTLSFSSVNFSAPSPYATGRLSYVYKGVKESTQMYVVWKQLDSAWVVSQFNIY